jgi:chorismate mutase
MRVATSDLDELRREIDRLDNAVVDLLIERLALVERIAGLKGDRRNGRVALRPAREAVILRRLVARAGQGFPHDVLVRMWRELLAATTRLQAPLSVAVYAPPDQPALWDIARDHFGSLTPIRRVASATHALGSIADRSAQVAVLPEPGGQEVWWQALLTPMESPIRVVARLPVVDRPESREHASAFAVAMLEGEPSGDDLTLLVLEAEAGMSRAGLLEPLALAGLEPRCLASLREPGAGPALHLVEVAGFIEHGDPVLADGLGPLRRHHLRVTPIGGYARPLSAAGRD